MSLEGIQLIIGAIFVCGFGFLLGLTLNRHAEKEHWLCWCMPWKCPYMGAWFFFAMGMAGYVLILSWVLGSKILECL